MIRINPILGDIGTEKTEPSPILKYNLEDYGIIFTKNNAEILLIHSRLYPEYIENKQPKIIVERADSSILYHKHVREAISRDDVLSIIKTTTLRDEKLHNSDVYSGRYHCKLLNEYANLGENEKQNIKISHDNLKKIKCLIPTSIQDRFLSYKNLPSCKKEYDVMFVGNICYDGISKPNILNWHRNIVVKKLNELKSKYNVFLYAEKNGKITLDQKTYQDVLNKSKICLSPWGMGEWNYRDFQSMYAKTVLIKPNSNHVFCYPIDIFENGKRYIPCSPDFCDLEQKIEMVLSNYKNIYETLEDNKNKLIESWNINKLTYDFAKFIKNL